MSRNKSNDRWKIYFPIGVALALIAGMHIGYQLYETFILKRSAFAGSGKSNFGNVEEMFHYVDSRYVDEVDNSKLSEDIISATLKTLDPHSTYITKDEIASVNESLSGEFEGIGVEFRIVKDTIRIINALTGGPSEALGILAGDMIINIEDTLVAGIDLKTTEVIRRLKGTKGTKVNIDVKRLGVAELIPFSITRDKIPLVSLDVGYMLTDEIGYLKLNRFSATTYEEFGEKLVELQEEHDMKKLIIDLRQNPGGYLDAATKIIDELIAGYDLIVYTEGKNYSRRDHNARREGYFEVGDLAVLIDQGSASASEILAGAVQDLDRGLVFGRRSFGKGLVQEQHSLSDGSAIRLTVARYYTPSGRSIQKEYTAGDKEYGDEISTRYKNGEFFHEDSIPRIDSLKYQTKSGKIVYGGGGITPDVFVPMDTLKGSDFYYVARGFVPGFIYEEYSQNTSKYPKTKDVDEWIREFKVSDKMLEKFSAFMSGESKLPVTGKEMAANSVELKKELKAFMAQQIYGNTGFYRAIHLDDDILQVAKSHLQDGKSTQVSLR